MVVLFSVQNCSVGAEVQPVFSWLGLDHTLVANGYFYISHTYLFGWVFFVFFRC